MVLGKPHSTSVDPFSNPPQVTSVMGDATLPLEIPANRDTSAAIFTVLITNMQVNPAFGKPPPRKRTRRRSKIGS